MNRYNNRNSCAILQPHYLPWIGYFEMIDRVDTFVFLDDVQFVKREWQNRNRIRKFATGTEIKWKWITVPVKRHRQDSLINEIMISNDGDWVKAHCDALEAIYQRSPFFEDFFPDIKMILRKMSCGALTDLNISLIEYVCNLFDIRTRFMRSSEIKVNGKREEKLLNISKEIGAGFYLANNATSEYVSEEYFLKDGVSFGVQNYTHPYYQQMYGGTVLPFISHLSIVDLLFNHGSKGIEVIRKTGLKKV